MNARITLFVVMVMILSACGIGTTSQPAIQTSTAWPTFTPRPVASPQASPLGNLFVYLHRTTFPDIDPSSSYSDELLALANVYETLTFYNPPGSPEVLSPRLATRWESNAEATLWTFYLRSGVKFHDGTQLDAQAVKFSIERTKSLGQGAAFMWDAVETIEVVEPYTVRFKLKYAAPLDLMAAAAYGAWIFSPAAVTVQGAQANEWFRAGHDAGSGPYQIESNEPGKRLTLKRFDNYWRGWKTGQFDSLIFELVVDEKERQEMLEFHAADFDQWVPASNVATLKTRSAVTIYTNSSFQNLLGFFNLKKAPTNNPLVRQALSFAFPYQKYNATVMQNLATQAHGPIPVGMWGHSETLFQYTYNLDQARQRLAEAGYPSGGLTLTITYDTGSSNLQRLAELWQTELAQLGVTLELRPLEWEAQWDLAKADPQTAQDIFIMYWWPSWITPYDYLFSMFHCEKTPSFNLGYYCNPEFDKLIDQANALSGSNRAEAERLFIEAQKILLADTELPAIFFYDTPAIHALSADIQGYVDNPAYPNVVFVYDLQRPAP